MSELRLAALRERMAAMEKDGQAAQALFVASPLNRTYLTGFSGSSGYVLVTADQAFLLTDFRYVEQAAAEAPAYQVVRHTSPYTVTLAEIVAGQSISRLAYESEHVTVAELGRLSAALAGVSLIPVSGVVEDMRLLKDAGEVARIEAAVACADQALDEVLAAGVIRAGATELDVAAALEGAMRRRGSVRPAFDTIVASGPRSSMPHGRASERVMQDGEFVTMDFGATVRGYCSDITRTIILGEASAEQRQVYDLVLRAQLAGVTAARPGITGEILDAAARSVIAAGGFGEHFGHGLGHGVGLAIHEAPRVSPVGGDNLLRPGMTTSIEPGIYVPGWGGVRIEDLVLITQDGCRVLTNAPKQLIEVR